MAPGVGSASTLWRGVSVHWRVVVSESHMSTHWRPDAVFFHT